MAPTRRVSRYGLFALVCVAALGCATVRFVSDYDDTTDHDITALQKSVDASLTMIATQHVPTCLYAAHAVFYQGVHADLHSLLIRNRARGASNQLTTDQIAVLDTVQIGSLEQLHQLASARTPPACMDSAALVLDQQAIDQSLEAILKLELAKTRGQ